MKTLYVTDFTQREHSVAFRTSPAYQLFSSDRSQVRAATLLAMLDAGWSFDVNEVSPAALNARPLLLQYLGTLSSMLRVPGDRGFTEPVDAANLALNGQRVQAALQARDQGADLGFLDSSLLVQHNVEQVAMRLLDAGADPWVQDAEGRDALDQALALGWLGLVDRLLNDPQAPSAKKLAERVLWVAHLTNPLATPVNRMGLGIGLPWVHAMVAFGHHPLLDRLLSHGLDINQRDAFGRTPLFYAPFALTARHAIDHGADVLVVDDRHQTAAQAWPHMVSNAAEKAAMQAIAKATLEQCMADDPERLKAQQTSTLFTTAVNDSKAVVVKFMRDNGLTVNARRPMDSAEDPGISLLAHVSRHAITDAKRSRAFLSHVLERVEDPWEESVPGIPDVWLALLASTDNVGTGATVYAGRVWTLMDQHYGLGGADGLGRFLDDGLRFLRAWATPGTRMAWAVPRTGVSGVQLWAGLLMDLLERTPEDQRLGSPLQVALTQGEGRRPRAWAWVDALTQVLHEHRHQEAVCAMSRLVGKLAGAQLPRDGRDADQRPQGPMMALVPVTPEAVHAMLPLITVVSKDRTTLAGLVKGTAMKDWDDQAIQREVFQVMKKALADGVAVETRAPRFNERMARLQAVQPFLAQAIEQQILRGAATGVSDPSDRSTVDGTNPQERTVPGAVRRRL